MAIYHYDLDDNLLNKEIVEKGNIIKLNTFQDDYYVIKSHYSNSKEQELKVSTYHSSDFN